MTKKYLSVNVYLAMLSNCIAVQICLFLGGIWRKKNLCKNCVKFNDVMPMLAGTFQPVHY